MARALELALAGERLELMPERAVFLPDHATLLVADAHIGKAVSFRRLGMPVPRGTTTETLATLSAAVDAMGAERLIFLGDFLHSARARADAALDALTRWRERHAGLRLTLVCGNHDLHAGDPPKALGIDAVCEPLRLGALALCHHPQTVEGAYVLAGHAHPCVVLGGRAQETGCGCLASGLPTRRGRRSACCQRLAVSPACI